MSFILRLHASYSFTCMLASSQSELWIHWSDPSWSETRLTAHITQSANCPVRYDCCWWDIHFSGAWQCPRDQLRSCAKFSAICFIALITTVVDRVSSLYVLFILHSSFVIYKLLTLSILLLLDKSTSAIAAGCVTAVSQHSIRHRSHPLPLWPSWLSTGYGPVVTLIE
jgi:hypothetical protein